MHKKNIRKTHLIKNKGLRRVCAVFCLCFALFAVALPFTRATMVSAANNTSLYPDDSIIIYTDYNPSFLVTWTARNVTTMAFAPRFVISSGSNDFGLIIGNSFCKMVSTDLDTEAQSFDVPFYNCSDGSSSRNPTPEYGFTLKCRAFLGKDFDGNNRSFMTSQGVYSGVTMGEYNLGDFKVYNRVEYIDNDGVIASYNYALYTLTLNPVYSSGSQRFACFKIWRDEETISLNNTFVFDSSKVQTQLFNYNYQFTGSLTDDVKYNDGYNAGYGVGRVDGETLGYNNGYDKGYNVGISEGFRNATPWTIIVDGVNNFLKIDILPGVSLSVIFSISFGIILLGFVMKIFLGG